jgi:protein tyrosine phosphatase
VCFIHVWLRWISHYFFPDFISLIAQKSLMDLKLFKLETKYVYKMDFFWLIPQKIAGGSLPNDLQDIEQLQKNNIRHIVSLILNPSQVRDLVTNSDIELHSIPIKDWGIPSHTQIQQFLTIVNENLAKNQATYVHCLGGCGRTGTMLALYLVHLGYKAEDSIIKVRSVRPCSVETEEQELLIINFEMKN